MANLATSAEPGADDKAPLWMPVAFVLLTLARAAVATRLEVLNDEAYYWDWSRHLDASYFDHPPMVAYLIALSTRLFGTSAFFVHLPAIVLAFLTALVLRLLVLRLYPGRERLAWATVLVFNIVPLFAMGSLFTTPDAPLAFFWVSTIYLVRIAIEGRRRAWYLAGLCAGLGLLSKYNVVLLLAAVFLYLLTSRHRALLRTKEPYLAAAIAMLAFAPVIAWNAQHDWASFGFQLVVRHHRAFTPLLNIRRFVTCQLSISPLLMLVCFTGMYRDLRRRLANDARRYLLCISGVVLGFFAIVGIFALTLPNWPALAYVTLLPGALELMRELRSKALWYSTIGLAATLSVLFCLQMSLLAVPLPRDLDFALESHGWREAAQKVQELRRSLPDPEKTFVCTGRFQDSALLAFQLGEAGEVTRLGGQRRDQYDYWRDETALAGHDAIFVSVDRFFRDPKDLPFEHCDRAADWTLVQRERNLRTFSFWRCHGYRTGAATTPSS